jgi:tetratricopeptide (TPR) repeat protein
MVAQISATEVAAEYARALTAKRAGEARSWIVLARTLTADADFDEQLAALNRAIELEPENTSGYTSRARLLAEQRRFDEALASCVPNAAANDAFPAAWRERLPCELRITAALVEDARGRRAEAVKKVCALTVDEPHNLAAWRHLADWYRDEEHGNNRDYLHAAQQLTRLAPHESVPFGYLAEAKLRAGDRAGAKACLAHALNLAPEYDFARDLLFTLQIEDDELEEANRTLELVRRHAERRKPSRVKSKSRRRKGRGKFGGIIREAVFASKRHRAAACTRRRCDEKRSDGRSESSVFLTRSSTRWMPTRSSALTGFKRRCGAEPR